MAAKSTIIKTGCEKVFVMQRVVRPETPPEVLSRPEFGAMRLAYHGFLALPANRRTQTRPPDRHLPDVPGLLAAVAEPFGGSCAFCGIEKAQAVYRFRPTGDARPIETKASPDTSLHYGWLADAWQNLYPICRGCRPADPTNFPVTGKRDPIPGKAEYLSYQQANSGHWPYPIEDSAVLIDPCADDPAQAMMCAADGQMTALNERGRLTIAHFNLNRAALVTARATGPNATRQRPTRKVRAAKAPHEWELASIKIENFKAIEGLHLDMPERPMGGPPRAPVLLILGENAAGKSTILEAVALALMPDAARRQLMPDPAPLLLNPRYLGSPDLPVRRQGCVSVHFVDKDAKADVTLRLTSAGFTTERGAKDLPQVFAYGAYRHYLDGVRRRSASRGVVSLFKSQEQLSNPRDWLVALPDRRFDEVVQALRFVFGVDFEAIRRRDGDCFVVTLTDGVEQETPILAVSSGFRTVLALVCDVLRWLLEAPATKALKIDNMPAIILIDEVEAHLHPRWKMAIVEGLRQALPAATFLMTTHDPLCLRRAAPGEVRVMTRQRTEGERDSDVAVIVEALDSLPDMGALTVDQLLTADFFGLGDTDDPDTVRALDSLMNQSASGIANPDATPGVMRRLQAKLLQDLPIGRTEVERIVQEAVKTYLTERRSRRPAWRDSTRDRILTLLRDL
ncbi:AAA family ATPase [Phaeovulum sp.]|uniref:AAA family ATPase n=1 Tax=Phaeovulum sp. TaxID=2934796 RepID=UPI0039E4F9CF